MYPLNNHKSARSTEYYLCFYGNFNLKYVTIINLGWVTGQCNISCEVGDISGTKKMRLRLPAQRQGDDIHWSDNPTMSNIEDDIKNQLGLSHFTVLTAFPLYVCSQCDKAWNLIRSTVICHFVFTTTRDTSMDRGGTVWELCSEVFFEVLPFQPKNPIPLQLKTNQNQWATNRLLVLLSGKDRYRYSMNAWHSVAWYGEAM